MVSEFLAEIPRKVFAILPGIGEENSWLISRKGGIGCGGHRE